MMVVVRPWPATAGVVMRVNSSSRALVAGVGTPMSFSVFTARFSIRACPRRDDLLIGLAEKEQGVKNYFEVLSHFILRRCHMTVSQASNQKSVR